MENSAETQIEFPQPLIKQLLDKLYLFSYFFFHHIFINSDLMTKGKSLLKR